MSDDAIDWGDWGGEEQESKLLQPGEYTGSITEAAWVVEPWAERTFPGSGGNMLKLKVEIDAPAGYAATIMRIPRIKERRWQYRAVCGAAGVPAPSKDGPPWSPSCLVGKRVQVLTKIYTNPKTDESKVEIDKWFPAETWTQPDAGQPKAAEKPVARRTPTQKADAASGVMPSDDIPF